MNKAYPCLMLDLRDEILTFHICQSRFVTVCKGDLDTINYLFEDWQRELNVFGYRIDALGRPEKPIYPR